MQVFEKIQEYNKDLLAAKVARKYKIITKDPFSFFRGTNHLFYEDLSTAPFPDSPACWICGDLHIENFGSYKGDNRLVYFDINDFDEGILAPVGWEIVRVITSIFLAFDSLRITDKEAHKSCEKFLQKYAEILAEGSPRYIDVRTASGIVKRFLNAVEQRSDKKLLAKRTIKKGRELRLSAGKKKQLIIHDELKHRLIEAINIWMLSNNAPPNDYKVLDARFRLAGTGSLGIHRYVFLLQKNSDEKKHLLIDMKEATPSSLKPFVKLQQPEWQSEAHRMVALQKMIQNIPPAQLSTLCFDEKFFLMQEMQPTKDRINFKIIQDDFKEICCVLEDMAILTASAHLRGAGRKGSCTADDLILFGEDKTWHTDIINYALNYKQKVKDNFTEFKNAISKSRRSSAG